VTHEVCDDDVNTKGFYLKNMTKKNKSMTKIHTQIGVEQTKGNVRFYLYLYPLGI
jgi:hypothetical protein